MQVVLRKLLLPNAFISVHGSDRLGWVCASVVCMSTAMYLRVKKVTVDALIARKWIAKHGEKRYCGGVLDRDPETGKSFYSDRSYDQHYKLTASGQKRAIHLPAEAK